MVAKPFEREQKKAIHFGRVDDDSPHKLSRHFRKTEFQCKCGCYMQYFDELLFKMLEELRAELGHKPIKINSGYRCKAHNDRIGGTRKSQHMEGRAVDIQYPPKKDFSRMETARIAEKVGFTGIGVHDTFLHLDVRPTVKVAKWGDWKTGE